MTTKDNLQLILLKRLMAAETVSANFVMFNLWLLEFYDPEAGFAAVKSAELEDKLKLCDKTIQKYKKQALDEKLWVQVQKGARGRSSHLRPLFAEAGGSQ